MKLRDLIICAFDAESVSETVALEILQNVLSVVCGEESWEHLSRPAINTESLLDSS